MSMLSSLCDELRDAADGLDDLARKPNESDFAKSGRHASLMRDAADVIWGLRGRLLRRSEDGGCGTCEMSWSSTGESVERDCEEVWYHCHSCHDHFLIMRENEDGDAWCDDNPNFCPTCGERLTRLIHEPSHTELHVRRVIGGDALDEAIVRERRLAQEDWRNECHHLQYAEWLRQARGAGLGSTWSTQRMRQAQHESEQMRELARTYGQISNALCEHQDCDYCSLAARLDDLRERCELGRANDLAKRYGVRIPHDAKKV